MEEKVEIAKNEYGDLVVSEDILSQVYKCVMRDMKYNEYSGVQLNDSGKFLVKFLSLSNEGIRKKCEELENNGK